MKIEGFASAHKQFVGGDQGNLPACCFFRRSYPQQFQIEGDSAIRGRHLSVEDFVCAQIVSRPIGDVHGLQIQERKTMRVEELDELVALDDSPGRKLVFKRN